MLRLAEIADLYGSSEVRLTVWQNLIIPNIPDAFVETVKKTLVKMGRHRQRTAQALGIGVRTLGLKLKKWKQEQLIEATL